MRLVSSHETLLRLRSAWPSEAHAGPAAALLLPAAASLSPPSLWASFAHEGSPWAGQQGTDVGRLSGQNAGGLC